MSEFLIQAMTPEEQSRFLEQVYELLGAQVKHYHQHYHMGDNTSVPVETAKDLLDSILYTLEKAGLQNEDLTAALARGQAVLEARAEEAGNLLKLVKSTLPDLASDSLHAALAALETFLAKYDLRHFAARAPDFLEYPLLFSHWEDLRGIDRVSAYLRGLWLENQILDLPDPDALEELLSRLGPDYGSLPINLCEQPLINALGLALLGKTTRELAVSEADRKALLALLPCPLDGAMDTVCREWDLSGPAADYARLVIPALRPRLDAAISAGDLSRIFL